MCSDINIEISEVDYLLLEYIYFRHALEITFLLNKHFFLRMACKLLSQNAKPNYQEGGESDPNKSGGVRKFRKISRKKISEGSPY